MQNQSLLIKFVVIFSALSWANPTLVVPERPVRLEEMRRFYGVDQYPSDRIGQVRVAVLDNGFGGFQMENGELPTALRSLLPSNAKIVTSYSAEFLKAHGIQADKGDPVGSDQHGLHMAQIIWQMAGQKSEGPQLFLLNASGGTNFRAAIKYAIYEAKADIIVHSMNWEYGGNFDGKGFLNEYVNEATAAGVIWVNAAGNYGGRVFDSNVTDIGTDGFLSFSDNRNYLRVRGNVQMKATITLNYTSDWASETTGTETDLDLLLYDENEKLVASSERRQIPWSKAPLKEGQTFLSRERLEYPFEYEKNYRLRIRLVGGSITENDRIRVTLVPQQPAFLDEKTKRLTEPVALQDATPGREIMIPADNSTVITVGDLDNSGYAAKGPTTDGRTKPDIYLEKSTVALSTGNSVKGTSYAAAIFAGITAVMKARNPNLDRLRLLQHVTDKARLPVEVDASLINLTNFPVSQMPSFFQSVVNLAREAFGNQPLIAGQYRSGRFALGVPENPADFIVRLCGEKPRAHLDAFAKERDDSEFYVTINSPERPKPNPSCYRRDDFVCCIRNLGEGKALYPWEHFREEPTRYLHLRAIGVVDETQTEASSPGLVVYQPRVWKTPAP